MLVVVITEDLLFFTVALNSKRLKILKTKWSLVRGLGNKSKDICLTSSPSRISPAAKFCHIYSF